MLNRAPAIHGNRSRDIRNSLTTSNRSNRYRHTRLFHDKPFWCNSMTSKKIFNPISFKVPHFIVNVTEILENGKVIKFYETFW